MKRLAGLLTVTAALSLGATSWIAVADDGPAREKPTSGDVAVENAGAVDVESDEEEYKPRTKSQLRRELTPIQYRVTQNEDTEPAFQNKYWNNKAEGIYKCIVCDRALFSSETKYKSGTGWPSFYAPLDEKKVGYRSDRKLFYTRTEVHCERCKAHLGHVFDDGPPPTGKRYCMNSASLKFVEKSKQKEAAKKTAVKAVE